MLKAKIFVELKPSVLDPQGKAVTNSLHNLGFEDVSQTRIGKYIEIVFDSSDREVREQGDYQDLRQSFGESEYRDLPL